MGLYFFACLLFLIGGGFLFFTAKMVFGAVTFISISQKTTGWVINHQMARNSDRQATYLPVVEFKTAGGNAFRVTSTVGSNPPAKIGTPIKVRYLPKNPSQAKISSFTEMWLLPLIFLVIGSILLGAGMQCIFNVR